MFSSRGRSPRERAAKESSESSNPRSPNQFAKQKHTAAKKTLARDIPPATQARLTAKQSFAPDFSFKDRARSQNKKTVLQSTF